MVLTRVKPKTSAMLQLWRIARVRHTYNATGEMNLLFCVTVIKQKLQKYAKTWMYFNFPVLTWVSSVFLCVILLNMSFFVVLSPVK